jgi:hypothetical protein
MGLARGRDRVITFKEPDMSSGEMQKKPAVAGTFIAVSDVDRASARQR